MRADQLLLPHFVLLRVLDLQLVRLLLYVLRWSLRVEGLRGIHTHTHTHTHARAHTHTHTHTHRQGSGSGRSRDRSDRSTQTKINRLSQDSGPMFAPNTGERKAAEGRRTDRALQRALLAEHRCPFRDHRMALQIEHEVREPPVTASVVLCQRGPETIHKVRRECPAYAWAVQDTHQTQM